MRLSRLALAFGALVIACGGGTESSAPPPIDVPARDAGTGNSGPSSLTVTIDGDGTGVVTSAPAGIECPGKCNQGYARDERVTLTATPGEDSVFTGWSGGGCSGFAECTATIGGPVTVVAKFAKKLNVVVVSKSGTGTGTVSSTPGGIACGATRCRCAPCVH